MAEEDKEDKPEEAEGAETAEGESEEPSKDRGPIKLIGAIGGIVVIGAILAFMAIPSKEEPKVLMGPFPFQILEKAFQANTLDGNLTRYVRFTPHCEFYAYEEGYLAARVADPLYLPELKAALSQAAANKTVSEIMEGVQRELFPVEVQERIAPILFPVHVGETAFHRDADPLSGLRPGFSFELATFRGLFHEHELVIDGVAQTVQLDDGAEVPYSGTEQDLVVHNAAGASLYLDVTGIDTEFQGVVPVGVHGRVRKVMIIDPMAQ